MLVIAMLVVVMVITMIMMMAVIVTHGRAPHGRADRPRMAWRGRIGAAFGIERRLDLDHARAQPLHHRLDDVVAPDAQALRHDLGRQMAVAEMPGDPHQMHADRCR